MIDILYCSRMLIHINKVKYDCQKFNSPNTFGKILSEEDKARAKDTSFRTADNCVNYWVGQSVIV